MMNIEARRELMAILCEISELAPWYRLGQLMGLMTSYLDEPYGVNSIVEVEDEELLPAARYYFESCRNMDPESRRILIQGHLDSEHHTLAALQSTVS